MKKNLNVGLIGGLIGIFLIFSFALTGCPTGSSGTDTETSVIKVSNVPEGTSKIFLTVYDDFTTKTVLAYGESVVSGGTGTLGLLTPAGNPWTGTETVAIAALADRASGKSWDAAALGETVYTLDWNAGAALEGELFDSVKANAQSISPITEEEEIIPPSLDDELKFGTLGEIKYYSLSTGKEVEASKANTTEWDIAIEKHVSALLFIYTNSGSTAVEKNSGGKGGVWYTDSTDFDAVTLNSKVVPGATTEYEPYVTDVVRFLTFGMGANAKTHAVKMNIMTYFGFNSGGKGGLSSADAFTSNAIGNPPYTSYKYFDFDKKALWSHLGMPPAYSPTNQVYIIRHADDTGGEKYSKLQVDVGYASSTFALTFKYGAVE
ncbi:MAG: HmuY family protein [Treponema sp.]|jgi:hypothetical protein|nr:HmuY family protein [Treponema sp.]